MTLCGAEAEHPPERLPNHHHGSIMRAEIIAIGDELTSGQRLDTNSQWLSQQLALLGIPVIQHTTVNDDLPAIVAALDAACQRCDLVVVTGGLGPTADDLTRQAIAQLAGCALVEDPESLAHIRQLFKRRGRVMPERNTIQACFPAGSRPIPNPHGTAPGIQMTVERADDRRVELFALPGVPAELWEMWTATVAPAISAGLGTERRVLRQRVIRCFGAGESEIEGRLPDLVRRGRDPLVGITASQATITLRVVAEGMDECQCDAKIAPTVSTIYECLGTLIYGEGELELEDVVHNLLADRQLTLASVEWGTAGLVAQWLGSVPASSRSFRAGLVVSDFTTLSNLLGVETGVARGATRQTLEQVRQMALAVAQKSGTDLGLAVGPFPQIGLAGASERRVHVAVARGGRTLEKSFLFAAHPALQRQLCAKQALNVLRLALLEQSI